MTPGARFASSSCRRGPAGDSETRAVQPKIRSEHRSLFFTCGQAKIRPELGPIFCILQLLYVIMNCKCCLCISVSLTRLGPVGDCKAGLSIPDMAVTSTQLHWGSSSGTKVARVCAPLAGRFGDPDRDADVGCVASPIWETHESWRAGTPDSKC